MGNCPCVAPRIETGLVPGGQRSSRGRGQNQAKGEARVFQGKGWGQGASGFKTSSLGIISYTRNCIKTPSTRVPWWCSG